MNATVIFAQLGPLGYDGSYPTVKRYVSAKKEEFAHQATVRFETLPGYQAQVDFGKVSVEFLSGEVRRVTIFCLQMGFSRYRVAYVCPDETRDTLIACLSSAFSEIGGVPSELLVDNMKPVVTTPKTADEPAVLADDWMRFCAYHGIVTNACWPYRARDQGQGGAAGRHRQGFPGLPHLSGRRAPGDGAGGRDHPLQLERPLHHQACAPAPPGARAQLPKPSARASLLLHRHPRADRLPRPAGLLRGQQVLGAVGLCRQKGEGQGHAGRSAHLLRAGALIAAHKRRPKGTGATIMDPDHYQGLPGADLAFTHLERLEELGLSPFTVERRPLSVYEEVTLGDR